MSLEDRFATVGRARVRWTEAGDAHADEPFLLVHGLGSGMVRWRDAVPHLARARRTIMLDLPGYGRSDAPQGSYTPAWLAGALRAFCNDIGVERAIVVGNSLGGLVAMWFAAAWPARAGGLVLVSPALPNDGPAPSRRVVLGAFVPAIPGVGDLAFRRYMRRPAERLVAESLARNCTDPARVPEATVAALVDDMRAKQASEAHLRASIASNRALVWAVTARREETWRVARAVRVPTMLLWGGTDLLMPLHIGSRAVKEIPGSQLIVLDDCGHNPQLDRPAEFAGATIAFARSLEGR